MHKWPGLLFLVFLAATSAQGYEANYINLDQANLAKLLAPPPAPQSGAQKQDLQEVLEAQRSRSVQESERAVADNDTSIYRIAGEVLGPKFTARRLPKLDTFFNRVTADTRAIFLATKDVWDRPRPFAFSSEVNAIGERPTSGSYPSGHSTRGYVTAIILANMVPERATELYARGREYGINRVVAGVHYPTDIEGGRIGATVIASALMQSAKYRKDFEEAKTELRSALGMTLAP
jgi:acid phosphatase (class A)